MAAQITPGCEVGSASGSPLVGTIDFGRHSALEAGTIEVSLVHNTALAVRCTTGVSLKMAVDGGQEPDANRHLHTTADEGTLTYKLYRDPQRSQEFSINRPISVGFDDPNQVRIPLYARAELPGNLPGGIYNDVITLTLSW